MINRTDLRRSPHQPLSFYSQTGKSSVGSEICTQARDIWTHLTSSKRLSAKGRYDKDNRNAQMITSKIRFLVHVKQWSVEIVRVYHLHTSSHIFTRLQTSLNVHITLLSIKGNKAHGTRTKKSVIPIYSRSTGILHGITYIVSPVQLCKSSHIPLPIHPLFPVQGEHVSN